MSQNVILNFNQFDAFAEEDALRVAEETPTKSSQIHLRVQQRNGRKCITTVQGLSETLDLKRMIKIFKKSFSCNGAIKPDKETNSKVLQMSGDQRQGVKTFLINEKIVAPDDIIVHGV